MALVDVLILIESLNRSVLEENWSIKTDLATFLLYLLSNVDHLAWPDPRSFQAENEECKEVGGREIMGKGENKRRCW